MTIKEKIRDWSGRLYIDNVDAFTEYGVFVLDNEYKQLVEVPAFKKLDSTEWMEFDGAEYDLSSPVLGSKNVQIEFGAVRLQLVEGLLHALSDEAYHSFYFAEIGATYRLRLVQNGSISSLYRMGKAKLTFANDFPETYIAGDAYELGTTEVKQRGYSIDGIDFSQYGVWILDGSDDSIRKMPQVRPSLTTDVRTIAGVIYDHKDVRFKTKDVTLKCLINAESIGEFWRRWRMLFGALTASGERSFYFDALKKTYACFFKSNKVSKFKILQNGHIWCEFTVVLCFTGEGISPMVQYALLATECTEETLVVLEDGETTIKIAINNIV